jgi:hypothetical protein
VIGKQHPHVLVKPGPELHSISASFSREDRLWELAMLWQPCRRSFLRRTLKFHRALGRPTSLEELFQGHDRIHRRPRTKERNEKVRGSERK